MSEGTPQTSCESLMVSGLRLASASSSIDTGVLFSSVPRTTRAASSEHFSSVEWGRSAALRPELRSSRLQAMKSTLACSHLRLDAYQEA